MLRAWEDEPLLGRPISVHGINENNIEFLYRTQGRGTKILSKLESGNNIDLMGPLGNGFDVDNIKGNVAIVCGGIGIAPMKYVAESLKNCNVDFYAGFKEEVYLLDSIKSNVSNLIVTTNSGKLGYKGYITDKLKPENYDVVLCCGPEIMMEKVIKMCRNENIPSYISMEKKMACGVGACLVCTCKTKLGNKRTCKDGPVFKGEDIILRRDI